MQLIATQDDIDVQDVPQSTEILVASPKQASNVIMTAKLNSTFGHIPAHRPSKDRNTSSRFTAKNSTHFLFRKKTVPGSKRISRPPADFFIFAQVQMFASKYAMTQPILKRETAMVADVVSFPFRSRFGSVRHCFHQKRRI